MNKEIKELCDRSDIIQRYSVNGRIDSYILTSDGVKNILSLNPDDVVYEYNTGRPIMIRGITYCEPQPIYEITYTDGRTMKVPVTEMIYTGGNDDIHQLNILKNKIDSFIFDKVKPCIIDFNRIDNVKFVMNKIRDPYLVGALLTYGDWSIPYINLPLVDSNVFDYFSNMHLVEPSLLDSKIVFKWRQRDDETFVTWGQFFPQLYYGCTSEYRQTNDIFISEYTMESLSDRLQFIQGIFDIGWDKSIFPDHVGIIHFSETRLKEIQRVLWSLGILSKISYDPNIQCTKWSEDMGMKWRLDVIYNKHRIFPNFFYNEEAITYHINNDLKLVDLPLRRDFILKIESIKCYKSSGYMFNVVTENPCMVYVTDNYLPRVSSI